MPISSLVLPSSRGIPPRGMRPEGASLGPPASSPAFKLRFFDQKGRRGCRHFQGKGSRNGCRAPRAVVHPGDSEVLGELSNAVTSAVERCH